MAQRDIYVDTDVGEIVTSATDSTPKPLPPMVQGDILALRIFLLKRNTTFLLGSNPYEVLNNSELTLRVGIGPKDGTPGSDLYTSQFAWTPNSLNTWFEGDFPLNTTAIATQIGEAESAEMWFEIEVTNSNGYPWTVFQRKVPVQAEVIESAAVEVPPGQVALTVEDGDARYMKRAGLKVIYLRDTVTNDLYALYFENGSFQAVPVTGAPPDL